MLTDTKNIRVFNPKPFLMIASLRYSVAAYQILYIDFWLSSDIKNIMYIKVSK